jgi:hypothetical protein
MSGSRGSFSVLPSRMSSVFGKAGQRTNGDVAAPGMPKVPVPLQVQPVFRCRIRKGFGERESGIRRDPPFCVDDLVEPGEGPSQMTGELLLGQVLGGQKNLDQDFSGMHRLRFRLAQCFPPPDQRSKYRIPIFDNRQEPFSRGAACPSQVPKRCRVWYGRTVHSRGRFEPVR